MPEVIVSNHHSFHFCKLICRQSPESDFVMCVRMIQDNIKKTNKPVSDTPAHLCVEPKKNKVPDSLLQIKRTELEM